MVVAPMENFRPLRRSEFHQLAELGAFEDERVELLDGVLVAMNPIGTRHSSAVDALSELLILALAGRARVRIQNPFAASDISEPQPDLLVAPLGDYRADHPAEAHLIIEVAESSLAKDRGTKARIYAQRNVPEYWIVDVADARVEVYRDPDGGNYRSVRVVGPGESVTLLSFPEVSVRVADVFA
jgi:Uma2 family endonuclease